MIIMKLHTVKYVLINVYTAQMLMQILHNRYMKSISDYSKINFYIFFRQIRMKYTLYIGGPGTGKTTLLK